MNLSKTFFILCVISCQCFSSSVEIHKSKTCFDSSQLDNNDLINNSEKLSTEVISPAGSPLRLNRIENEFFDVSSLEFPFKSSLNPGCSHLRLNFHWTIENEILYAVLIEKPDFFNFIKKNMFQLNKLKTNLKFELSYINKNQSDYKKIEKTRADLFYLKTLAQEYDHKEILKLIDEVMPPLNMETLPDENNSKKISLYEAIYGSNSQ